MSASQPQMVGVLDNARWQRDSLLVQRCLNDDDQAWALLLDRYGDLIYTIACRTELLPENVADVFQSVCCKMVGNLRTLKHEPSLSPWITAVTLGQCRRARRRQDQPGFHSVQAEKIRDVSADDVASSQEEMIQVLEQERLVRQAISMLEPRCQRVVTDLLYDKGGESNRKSENQLSSALRGQGGCLKKLLRILEDIGF